VPNPGALYPNGNNDGKPQLQELVKVQPAKNEDTAALFYSGARFSQTFKRMNSSLRAPPALGAALCARTGFDSREELIPHREMDTTHH
jgi:hypothetical protein